MAASQVVNELGEKGKFFGKLEAEGVFLAIRAESLDEADQCSVNPFEDIQGFFFFGFFDTLAG